MLKTTPKAHFERTCDLKKYTLFVKKPALLIRKTALVTSVFFIIASVSYEKGILY